MNESKTLMPKARARRRKSESVTLQNIADRVGVHVMTVSHALKGTGRVADATRTTILGVAAEMNYKPNRAARALVTGRTGAVAVLTGPVSEHFYAHALHLLEHELEADQIQMVFTRARDGQGDFETMLQSGMVDGVIAIDAFSELRALSKISSFALPCVYAGVLRPELAPSLSVDSIAIDLSGAAREAAQSLLDLGCARIAYLISNEGMSNPEDVRARTYLDTLQNAGRTLEIINVNIGTDTSCRELTRSRLRDYIQRSGAPDGLLCQNDEMAIAAYRALRDLNLRVPEDVRLIGCDGLDDMEYFDPPISTLVQPIEETCALAWRFLQRRLANPDLPLQHAVLQAQLRKRPSMAR